MASKTEEAPGKLPFLHLPEPGHKRQLGNMRRNPQDFQTTPRGRWRPKEEFIRLSREVLDNFLDNHLEKMNALLGGPRPGANDITFGFQLVWPTTHLKKYQQFQPCETWRGSLRWLHTQLTKKRIHCQISTLMFGLKITRPKIKRVQRKIKSILM